MKNMKTTDDQDELFVVVDKNDDVIGYQTRRDCHRDKSLIHRAVDVLIFNDRGELLLQKRSKTKDMHPGCFTVSASGHVAKGQNYRQTAERELAEEIGIHTPLKMITTYLSKLPHETEMTTVFKSIHNGPFELNKQEVDVVKFVSPDRLSAMQNQLTPGAKDTLRQLKLL